MRVAVIGLGGIAQKAYLPTLAARAGVDLHVMTRTRERLDAVADTYRVPADRRFTDLDSLLLTARPDAAFVHVPTDQHPAIVRRLIEARVPTYVDKPLADTADESWKMVEHAEKAGVPLMVGFNRRHVPAYVEAARLPRDVVILQKNQTEGAGPVRDIVFDDFIHVVDTLRWLAPAGFSASDSATRVNISGKVVDGRLHHVALTLSAEGFTATGIMNRLSGSKEERLEVMGSGAKREVVDLIYVIDHEDSRIARPVDGWEPVARQRGFEQICTAFLSAVRGDVGYPDLGDALLTHELCERIVAELDPDA